MSLVRLAVGLALFASCVIATAAPVRCAGGGADVACTDLGAVRGVVEDEMLAFKGMPFAKPPIGPLRWRPPQPAAPWSGVRDGGRFGPMCPQVVGKDLKGDEDCLYVNVWRPRERPEKPLPVMIWLTGGGNHSYSGEGTPGFGGLAYNGTHLVPQGVVFVSYNLRLGVLGFLAHPALDAERPERISGNYGSLDQVAMLNWVHRNIAAFGGDPNHVFLFGTSAGGGNICALLTSPLTKGLFHGVAMESSVPTGCEIPSLADAENGTGKRVAVAAGCDGVADVAACLRGKSTAEIVAAVPGTLTVLPRIYGPNVDGHVFPGEPIERIKAKQYPAMPIIIGNTLEETNPWANTAGPVTDEASYASAVERVFGGATRDRILAKYPLAAYPSPRAAFVRVTTDAEFTCQTHRVARALSQAQTQPVYRFLFTQVLDNDPTLKAGGAAHTIEHAYLFPGTGTYAPSREDIATQRLMVGYWTRMARTGDPNDAGDPHWPAFTRANDAYLRIGPVTQAAQGPEDAQCDFWDGIKLSWPHL